MNNMMSNEISAENRMNKKAEAGTTRSVSFGALGAIALQAILISALLVLPSIASATLMTLTFDDGAHDETIEFPGGILHGPYDWIESNGIRAAGFWAFDVGTPDAIFQQGHTHIRENFFGDAAERQHAWTNDLQGLFISLEEGQSFDIVSIDYTIRSRETLTLSLIHI